MKRFAVAMLAGCVLLSVAATDTWAGDQKATKYEVGSGGSAKGGAADTLKVIARLIEVPGTFPPNDLYNYVYIMKYRIMKIVSGKTEEKEILVGHYNPLIPRKKIDDKMDEHVDGDVEKFAEGDKHTLVLIRPIDQVWGEALEDDYFDVDASEKYYALKADVAK